ncbi:hypothetical protein HK100_011962, partial [Physocladia obscura]
RNDSDSDEDGAFHDDDIDGVEDENDTELREIKSWGDDLMGDEKDRSMLNAMTALDREKFLAERAERRQVVLDRLELKRKVRGETGVSDNRRISSRREEKSKNSKSLRALKRQRDEKSSKKSSVRAPTANVSSDRRRTSYYDDESSGSDNSRDRRRRRDSRSRSRSRSRSLSSDRHSTRNKNPRPPSPSTKNATYEQIRRITVARNDLEKWMYKHDFDTLLIDCFVRIVFGFDQETKQQKYRLCRIADVSEREKTYTVGNSVSKKVLHLAYGSFKEKTFLMDIVSNSPPTEDEFLRYMTALGTERMISVSLVEAKMQDLQKTRDHIYSNQEIEERISIKKALQRVPANIAAEKLILSAQLDQAREEHDDEKIVDIEARIASLDDLAHEKRQTSGKLEEFAKLNEKNRMAQFEEARRAEIELKNFKKFGITGTQADSKHHPKKSKSKRTQLNGVTLEVYVLSKDTYFDDLDVSDLIQ